MYLLPAIDLLDGRAVRLAKGDYHAVTVYNDDPAYQAQLFEEAGATWLHVVDLDGAKSGNPDNLEVVRAILARTSLKVEVGGGVWGAQAVQKRRRDRKRGISRCFFIGIPPLCRGYDRGIKTFSGGLAFPCQIQLPSRSISPALSSVAAWK